jgi:hypothetical protein
MTARAAGQGSLEPGGCPVAAEIQVTRPGRPPILRGMRRALTLIRWLIWASLAGAGRLWAHPIPDIPVRAYFVSPGEARIEIEIDPRFFADDPNTAPYLVQAEFETLSPAGRAALQAKAARFAAASVAFFFEPTGRFSPAFDFQFTGIARAKLRQPDDPVVLTGVWPTRLAAGLTAFRIQALPAGKYSVLLMNFVNGQPMHRVNVLFPGEGSYVLDLTGLGNVLAMTPVPGAVRPESGMGSTFVEFIRQGFVHVVPLGWDHILFVLGLFLLSRKCKPILWQVTMFTAAHTLTLGVATLARVSIPGQIVEPVIAASIAFIALENVFLPKYSRWRLAIVFLFGLVHGLGFASALQELDLPGPALVVGLLGSNLRVEGGQLTVIAIAWAVTVWLKQEDVYRRRVAIPASLLIACCGLWWTVQRIVA